MHFSGDVQRGDLRTPLFVGSGGPFDSLQEHGAPKNVLQVASRVSGVLLDL